MPPCVLAQKTKASQMYQGFQAYKARFASKNIFERQK